MDPAYRTWLWLLAGGVLFGLFVRPRTAGIVAAVCFLTAVLGLVLCAALSRGDAAMLFGVAAMAIPASGILAVVGAFVGSWLRAAVKQRTRRQEPSLGMPQPQHQINSFASRAESKSINRKLLPHQKAGRIIFLMAWLALAATVGIGAAVLLPALSRGGALPVDLLVMLGACFAFVIALFFVSGAVMRRKAWGRCAGIVFALLSLLGFPVGTLMGAYVMWQLIFGWGEGAAEV